jgi:hypothetical protein
MVRLVGARYDVDYRVWLKFSDGLEGVVDLSGELYGPVFEPLRDLAIFRQLRLDPDTHTIAWPDGADLAPEHLYDLLRAVADPALLPMRSVLG